MRVRLAVLSLLLFLALTPNALAFSVHRPTSGGAFAYLTPEAAPYVGARAVVHYVTQGPDAPPLQDADGSGVPDYVEAVSRSAERSLDFYAKAGFLAPLPDAAGPNAFLDVYIVHFDGDYDGVLGLALPAQQAADGRGGFFLVADDLEIGLNVSAGLEVTVAHELFHMTQFAYFPPPVEIPNGTPWADEGTAVAMSMLVYPEIRDRNNAFVLDSWLKETWKPLYYMGEGSFCDIHCYAGGMWWLWTWRLDPGIIREYYGRLYGYAQIGKSIGYGTQPLTEILKSRGFKSLYHAFSSFSVDTYRQGLPLKPAYSVKVAKTRRQHSFPRYLRARPNTAQVAVAYGLSSHFVPIQASGRGFELVVESALGPAPDLALIVGGPKGRRVTPKRSSYRDGDVLVRRAKFQVRFRNARERASVRLIVTAGRQDGVAYTLASDGL